MSYLVVPDDMSEVSELSLFLSWTMLKSANLEKSVLAPWPMSRADLRDSRSRTSSNFFLTSGPPFWKRKQITFYNLENSSNDCIITYNFARNFWKLKEKKLVESQFRVEPICVILWAAPPPIFSWLRGHHSENESKSHFII